MHLPLSAAQIHIQTLTCYPIIFLTISLFILIHEFYGIELKSKVAYLIIWLNWKKSPNQNRIISVGKHNPFITSSLFEPISYLTKAFLLSHTCSLWKLSDATFSSKAEWPYYQVELKSNSYHYPFNLGDQLNPIFWANVLKFFGGLTRSHNTV